MNPGRIKYILLVALLLFYKASARHCVESEEDLKDPKDPVQPKDVPPTETQKDKPSLTGAAHKCPKATKYGSGLPSPCVSPTDPNRLPASKLEEWFTKDMFEDLFPFANLGWGPSACLPYSYESFVTAARYFPKFGTSSPNKVYSEIENNRRDLAAFFAHVVQETGENNAWLYKSENSVDDAHNCFYRGGFYNWFEGGPTSAFLNPANPGWQPADGELCIAAGRYCIKTPELDYFYPCGGAANGSNYYSGCYFGRGAIQISYNYNYGSFEDFLKSRNVTVDLLKDPNLVMTKMDPPLAMMASLWFYMTPQPPKPAMHDIVMGSWSAGAENTAVGYSGPIFGPTSLIINNECNGEDRTEPGGGGESRRIKAFKWFCNYFKVPVEEDKLLSCKGMPKKLEDIRHNLSYQPDWGSTWKDEPCNCAPAGYGGIIPYFDPAFYPSEFVGLNDANRQKCIKSVYDKPEMYNMNAAGHACLKYGQQPNSIETTTNKPSDPVPPPKKEEEPIEPVEQLPPKKEELPPKKNATSVPTPVVQPASTGSASKCPRARKFGGGPPNSCTRPSDPNNLPASEIEKWFTKDMFEDLFPFANLGWGPSACFPYSYESFVIAARYFPKFGTSSPNKIYSAVQNNRRDLAAFFAHAIQETGENNAALYSSQRSMEDAHNCFYRGGFYNWFEGGPTSAFLNPANPGWQPTDGELCNAAGRYCVKTPELDYFYPCDGAANGSNYYSGCYFGRGAIQISYNYNYGQFGEFLKSKNVHVNLLTNPNLVITKMDPPLAMMASLWFYMTPQPPKPAMHDIVMGSWSAGPENTAVGYSGPIFGPTSLIINNECNGEDTSEPGGMPKKLSGIPHRLSYQPDWSQLWKSERCNCAPASYGGIIPFFEEAFYPSDFVSQNEANRQKCIKSFYENPQMYKENKNSAPCLNF